MVLIRLFGLLLLFTTISSTISVNHSFQDGNVDSEVQGGSIKKVPGPRAYAKTTTQMNQGRRFGNNNMIILGEVSAKIESLRTSKVSNVGTWELRATKGLQYVGNRKNGRKLVSKNDDVSGFVAFNADYRGPRHHPPKNN